MNDKEPSTSQPRLGRLVVFVFFEALFVAGLFRADSALEYVLGVVLSVAGFSAIVTSFKEFRDFNRRN